MQTNSKTFNDFYKKYYPAFLRFVRKRGIPEFFVEDILSDAFLGFIKYAETDYHEMQLLSYFYERLRFCIADYYKFKMYEHPDGIINRDISEFFTDIEENHCETSNVEEELDSKIITDKIIKGLRKLSKGGPKSFQQALVLEKLFLDEKDYTEVAKEFGIPLGTVKSLMFRAKQKMRDILENSVVLKEAA